MSFRIKLFVTFVIYGSILALSTQLLVLKLNERTIKQESLTQASYYAQHTKELFEDYIQGITQRLHTIEDSELFYQFYKDKNNPNYINQLFLDIAKNAPNIMQIRFIDINGNEVDRVDRKNFHSAPHIVPPKELQNKHNRYYFQEIIKLKKSEYWYSKLDLNIEHGEIEKPIKPVIRIGTPLFLNGEKIGVLIINLFMKDFLYKLTKSEMHKVYLIDKDGYIMVEPSHKYCWSRYLKHKTNIPDEFRNDIQNILSHDKLFGKSYFAQKVFAHNLEEIYIVVVPDILSTKEKIDENFEQLLWILFIVFLLSIPLSYFLSIAPSKLKQEVDELNESLQDEALEREVLLSLFDMSDSVLFKWNNDETWSVASVSKSVKSLIGYSKEDFETHKILYSNCIAKEDLEKVVEEVTTAVEENKYFFTHEPYRIITKMGDIRWILDHTVIVRNKEGEVSNFVGYLSDITELKEKEFTLQALARTDQLTQIYNRVYLDELLKNQYYRYQRNSEPCSVILIDIDYFKSVNDDFGHRVGDKVLIEFARLLSSSIREGDVIGRWGGEEFLIVLPHTELEQAVLLAEKLRKKIEKYEFSEVGNKTASFGLACFEDDISIEKLIDNADVALYKAKAQGRNNVQVYEKR